MITPEAGQIEKRRSLVQPRQVLPRRAGQPAARSRLESNPERLGSEAGQKEKRRKPFSGIGSGGALDKGAFSLYQRSEETRLRWLPELDREKRKIDVNRTNPHRACLSCAKIRLRSESPGRRSSLTRPTAERQLLWPRLPAVQSGLC